MWKVRGQGRRGASGRTAKRSASDSAVPSLRCGNASFGTVLWAITALVLGALALLVPKVSLGLWPWISLAGVGLGLLGMLWARFNED